MASVNGVGRILPVEVAAEPPAPEPVVSGTGSGLWLEMPRGLRIVVERDFDTATLERLLSALAGA